uniref:PABS domain-containing protein n=1 Tax=Macaca mulatta TaxID=9544 RepID=A0A1D5QW44_MACMU
MIKGAGGGRSWSPCAAAPLGLQSLAGTLSRPPACPPWPLGPRCFRPGRLPPGLVPQDLQSVARPGPVAAGGAAAPPPALADILVFRSKTYGNVLVLDGVIQCTERDEFSYLEMMANLPLCSHPNPRKVLIMGGGDGGVLHEVVKHPSLESVVQCEIDEDVIQVSKKFLPGMAIGYSSSKLTLYVGDGFEFMKQNQDAFDVIITDSSDPMGPTESLFKESYYQLVKTALMEDGVLCCQGECQWLHLDLMKEMRQFCQSPFPVVAYAYCTIPTYPSSQIGFMLCSKNLSTNFQEPVQSLTQQQVAQMQLKDYNSDVHRTAFVLPEFARKALNDVR